MNHVSSLDRRLLTQYLLGITSEEYIKRSPVILNEGQKQSLKGLIARRASGEPVAKIIGQKHFWKDVFDTTSHTLDPRPDSEWLIDTTLRHFPDHNAAYHILECGTGTGCLILSLLREYPNASGVAIDKSPDALNIAKRNAKHLNLLQRCSFVRQDWTQPWATDTDQRFDLVISNPPYIPSSVIHTLDADVADYEPLMALDGGEDGLDAYRILFTMLPQHITPHGVFICEIGQGQHHAVTELGRQHQFHLQHVTKDLSSIIRILVFTYRGLEQELT